MGRALPGESTVQWNKRAHATLASPRCGRRGGVGAGAAQRGRGPGQRVETL